MAELEVKELYKSYDGVAAVRGVSFSVQPGEWVALLGPSGCGKTTTLRCVAGLEEVSDGQILLDGNVIASRDRFVPPQRREVNMVFQSYAIWPHMTVFENVAYGLKVRHVDKAQIKRRVEEALSVVQLAALGDRPSSQLSGGQQQRVAVARALVTEPRLLLFDEPLSNLDAKLRNHMRFELMEVRERLEQTALYVTHDQAEAMVVADRIVLMNQGEIVQEGSPREIYETPETRFAAEFIGVANFLDAVVVGIDADIVTLELPETHDRLSCPLQYLPEERRALGAELEVVIRPEHLYVAGEARNISGLNTWEAKVLSAAYLGGYYDCTVAIGPLTLKAQFDSKIPVCAGDAVTMGVDATRVVPLRGKGES